MAGFVAMQPNGRYCRFSTVVDCPTHCNMTEKDYLKNVTGTVKNALDGMDVLKNYLRSFEEVVEYFKPENMSQERFDELLEIMKSEPTKYFST